MQTTSSQVLLLFCLVCVPICKCCSGDSDLIGKCGEEGDNCSTCYHTLVKSLMSSDSNVYKLSRAFFPTNSNDRPQFVIVTYQFKDMNSTLHHKVWYWSEKSSYFVYPLQTFEYLSLFFGKAAIFFSGNVSVTLDQECYFADHYMQHLTQRIKLYTAKKSIVPEIDDSYIAAAHNDESWLRVVKAQNDQLITIVYCTPTLAITIFILIAAVFIITSCYNSCTRVTERSNLVSEHNGHETTDSSQCNVRPTVVSIAVISPVFTLYTFAISCYACIVIKTQPKFMSNSSSLSDISILIAVADGILLFLCIATELVAFVVAINHRFRFDQAFIVLSFTILYPVLSVLLHFPYIILAYINDASLTGSMFILYTLTLSGMFLMIKIFYTIFLVSVLPCHEKALNSCLSQSDPNAEPLSFSQSQTMARADIRLVEENATEQTHLIRSEQPMPTSRQPNPRASNLKLLCYSVIFIINSLVLCVMILGVLTLLTSYLIILPITNGISNLFGRLVGTYQTALVIGGAYVTYKTFFDKKDDKIMLNNMQTTQEESSKQTYPTMASTTRAQRTVEQSV